MKKYVITSDRYLPLLEGHAHFFNKNWSKNEEVIVLCYDKPIFSLPNNYIIQSLGKQKDYGKYWTDALIPFFNNVKEEYFMILLDDHFLRKPIDLETLKKMETAIKFNIVDKAILYKPIAEDNWKKIISNNIVEINLSNETALNYRTTLQSSIWNKKYFLKYLKPNYTAWGFERMNRPIAKTDKATIIGPKNKRVYVKLNLILKGRINHRGLAGTVLDAEDTKVIANLTKEWK